MNIQVKIGELTFDVTVGDLSERPVKVSVDGELIEVWPEEMTTAVAAPVAAAPVQPAAPAAPAKAAPVTVSLGGGAACAPMPGVIIAVTAHPGDKVKPGDELVVLEAMKMKNPIRATRAATVCNLLVSPGDHVKKGQTLVEFVD